MESRHFDSTVRNCRLVAIDQTIYMREIQFLHIPLNTLACTTQKCSASWIKNLNFIKRAEKEIKNSFKTKLIL